ncbi:MAG TPA: class I SAM-dependent methyltransferase [Methylophilaceae bacterium]|nr:class I SAM-dependent methyltransferase [Methylophilaceae bacterium]HAJ71299.1 class I SAM-dependent methyltransferase [Methylophilaceae bacterium]
MATQEDIESHYDVDNDFFALFLDDKYRAYTCAVWENADNLVQAQVNKFNRLCDYANIKSGDSVIDVGCGWGGLLVYIAEQYQNTKAYGVTLSSNQASYINTLNKKNVSADNLSWEDVPVPEKKFDAMVCVCAIEHFATFEQSEAGLQREVYNKFFDWCLDVTTPTAQLGIQSIVITRHAENLKELRGAKYLRDKVFPGSALASISDIQAAIVDRYEVSKATTVGIDYVRTLQEWDNRLEFHKDKIIARYGEDLFTHYKIYFSSAIDCFASGYWDVFQVSLKRAKPIRAFMP